MAAAEPGTSLSGADVQGDRTRAKCLHMDEYDDSDGNLIFVRPFQRVQLHVRMSSCWLKRRRRRRENPKMKIILNV